MAANILNADYAEFMADLNAAMEGDPYLHLLIDKTHPLKPETYTPPDLVPLESGRAYTVGRAGLKLRRAACAALQTMAAAAGADGVNLLASSTYRSFEYQAEVYNRNVRENGQETADRESARPGYSQHQSGLVVDFGSITDEYAQTAAGRWITANAPRFGWIISFPDGYEEITGYRWECWHYRYMGQPLADFIQKWTNGIQQYGLQFIHVWEHGSL
ncbi:D-alanyl-D-alanine carboxypeptidase [Spirochaetia bacterium]|nr:D-alanyl-D-alanine carboxypeptidase [Spirochaetia bacterium]